MERPVVNPSAVSKLLRQDVEKGKMNAVEKASHATCTAAVASRRPYTHFVDPAGPRGPSVDDGRSRQAHSKSRMAAAPLDLRAPCYKRT
jgi:hypothetical protein